MATVWVATYWNTNDEADNGVVGVWATEELARKGVIDGFRQWPPFAGHEFRWFGERLRSRAAKGAPDRNWYDVRPDHSVTEWEVQGDSSAA